MPHGLSSRTTNREILKTIKGQEADAAMFYVGKERPWHGLGVSVAEAPTSEEAIKLAGLDYEVNLAPVFDADMKEIPNYQRTYRTDNGVTLGIVGKRYEVVNNKTAFAIMDSFGKNVRYDTAGALFSGEVVFINARLSEDMVIAGDKIEPYFLLKTTHDGTGSIIMARTPIRTVCQNTLAMAVGPKNRKQDNRFQKIKHTRNYDERVREAAKAMEMTSEYYREFEKTANGLVAVKYTERDFFKLMDQLYPMPEDKDAKRANTIAEREREKMRDAYYADDLNNIRETGWGAFNAIADYSDHMRESRGENAEANAFLRTFEATTMKDRALELILAK